MLRDGLNVELAEIFSVADVDPLIADGAVCIEPEA